MGESFNCGVVGYAQNITYVRLEPNKNKGPFWHQILPWVKGRHLVLDLTHNDLRPNVVIQDISLMSSMLQKKSIRLWLRGLTPDIARSLSQQRCPLPNVTCLDVDAPYYCTVCSVLRAVTINIDPTLHKSLAIGEGFPKGPVCPTCKTEMRFNDIPKQFFSFLQHMHAPKGVFLEPALINRAFNDAELSRAAADGGHLDKKLWWHAKKGQNGVGFADQNMPVTVALETGIAISLLITNLALLGALIVRIS